MEYIAIALSTLTLSALSIATPHALHVLHAGKMYGLEGLEVEADLGAAASTAARTAMAARAMFPAAAHAAPTPSTLDIVRSGGVLVGTTEHGQRPINDYSEEWMLVVHPEVFCNGVGGCPEGMSFAAFIRLLLMRYPMQQFAHNVTWMADAFNIQLRHDVNTQANVQLKMDPLTTCKLADLTNDQFAAVVNTLLSGLRGAQLADKLAAMTPVQQSLFTSFKVTSARVEGSPQSFARLRSQVTSCWHVFGAWTMMINLNPAELQAKWVFRMAGEEFAHEGDLGVPDDRFPDKIKQ